MDGCFDCRYCGGWRHEFGKGYTIFCRLHGETKLRFDCPDYKSRKVIQ